MQRSFFLLFLFFFSTIKGQNLVPNYSFEEYYQCPVMQGQFYVDYWFEPPNNNNLSAEYYNDCSLENTQTDVPENLAGFQYPHEGEGYVGIFCYGNDSAQREYVEIQLISPLINNQEYEFSMYVSLPERFRFAANNLGALFTKNIVEGDGSNEENLIEANPQIKAEDPITDQDNWTQITGTFIATGGEEYLTIGNFFSDENTEVIDLVFPDLPWSYYYIDSVSLIPVILDTNENELEKQLSVYPNPVNDFITIEIANNQSLVTIKLYNIIGNIIYEKNINNEFLKIDMSDLSSGIYLLEITDSESNQIVKKISKK